MNRDEIIQLTIKQVSGIVRLTRGEETQELLDKVINELYEAGFEEGYERGWN